MVINKIDLVEPADLEPLVGVYAQMGYLVLLVSAASGLGLDRLRRELAGLERRGRAKRSRQIVAAQCDRSGSTCAWRRSSAENQKGKHTTTTAQLWPLASGGYVVDTPGIRQFQLWDVVAEEVEAGYRDLRRSAINAGFPIARTFTSRSARSKTRWPTAGSTHGATKATAICSWEIPNEANTRRRGRSCW